MSGHGLKGKIRTSSSMDFTPVIDAAFSLPENRHREI
jgi:hypothetical protein